MDTVVTAVLIAFVFFTLPWAIGSIVGDLIDHE